MHLYPKIKKKKKSRALFAAKNAKDTLIEIKIFRQAIKDKNGIIDKKDWEEAEKIKEKISDTKDIEVARLNKTGVERAFYSFCGVALGIVAWPFVSLFSFAVAAKELCCGNFKRAGACAFFGCIAHVMVPAFGYHMGQNGFFAKRYSDKQRQDAAEGFYDTARTCISLTA